MACCLVGLLQTEGEEIPQPTPLEDFDTLQSQLDEAIEKEDYAEAAELRDQLKNLKVSCQVTPPHA